ncbi:MAG TPA: VanZ family protein [Burkholderiales bacterium]|jgi:VanZ family protein
MTHDAAVIRTGATGLVRTLLAVYALLIVYASLYPLEGWRDPGISPLAFLGAALPRRIIGFDVVINVLGYMPVGILGYAVLRPQRRAAQAWLLATLGALMLSLAMEALQSYLPARTASNLDVACNTLGAALGAAAAFVALPHVRWHLLREELFLPGHDIDLGLVLLGLWLFVQLNPATLLFGVGDLRPLLETAPSRGHAPQFFIRTEAFIAAANLVAVGLLFSSLLAPGRPARVLLIALLAAALAVKAAAFAVLMQTEQLFAWLTPGAQAGLATGLAVALAALALPRTARLVLAAMLVMAATVLVNLVPPNPYLAASLKVWQQGHFLNFNGLTRLVGTLWPFAALGYLIFLASRRR